MNLFNAIDAQTKKDFNTVERYNKTIKNDLVKRGYNVSNQIYTRFIDSSNYPTVKVGSITTQTRPSNFIFNEATVITDLDAYINKYPVVDGEVASFVGEGKSLIGTDTTIKSVPLTKHRVGGYLIFSIEVLKTNSADLQNGLEQDMKNAVLQTIQDAVFSDNDGSNYAPVGLFYNRTLTNISSYDDIINVEADEAKEGVENGVWVLSPSAFIKAHKILNGNMPIYQNGLIDNYRVIVSNSLKGDKAIFGDLKSILVGFYANAIGITVDATTQQHKGEVVLYAETYCDTQLIKERNIKFCEFK